MLMQMAEKLDVTQHIPPLNNTLIVYNWKKQIYQIAYFLCCICSPTEIHFQSGTTVGTEGQQLMLCVTLETTLEGGIINPLTVTLNISVDSVEEGTEFMSVASLACYYICMLQFS